MAETEAQRLARQRDHDLIQQGRALQLTDSRLNALEDHAGEVNGQIKALTSEVQQVKAVLGRMDAKLDAEREGDARNLSKATIVGIATGGVISAGMLVTTILEVVIK